MITFVKLLKFEPFRICCSVKSMGIHLLGLPQYTDAHKSKFVNGCYLIAMVKNDSIFCITIMVDFMKLAYIASTMLQPILLI